MYARVIGGCSCTASLRLEMWKEDGIHLESQALLDLFLQRLGNNTIELSQHLHGELRSDTFIANQFVEGIRQRQAETVSRQGMSATRLPDFTIWK